MMIRQVIGLMLLGSVTTPAHADECNRKYIEFMQQMAPRQQLASQERNACAQMQALQAMARDYIAFYRICPSADPMGQQMQIQRQIIQTPIAAQCAGDKQYKARERAAKQQTGVMKK